MGGRTVRVHIHSRSVWISEQDVQKPTVKPFVEVVAVEMCVELEGEQLRETLRKGKWAPRRNLANRTMLGRGPEMNPALGIPPA